MILSSDLSVLRLLHMMKVHFRKMLAAHYIFKSPPLKFGTHNDKSLLLLLL
jgi:hypothetical protein